MSQVSDVLRRAAGVLDERGWCQNNNENADGTVCALGAINVAITGDPDPEAWLPLDKLLFENVCHVLVQAAGIKDVFITRWNDREGRTVDEVKAAMVTAAECAERTS